MRKRFAIVLMSLFVFSGAIFITSHTSRDAEAQDFGWISNPAELPPGLAGTTNCTFEFGQDVPDKFFHPEAGCWERPGANGWIRQQFKSIHVPAFAPCSGGPGDANAIRICRLDDDGTPMEGALIPEGAPCVDESTGENGCARCVVNPVCH